MYRSLHSRTLNSIRRTLPGTLLVVLALLTACGPNVELPPLATIETSKLLNDVAIQLDSARQQVIDSPNDSTLNGRYGLVLATYGRDEAADIAFRRARLLAPKEARWAFFHSFVLRRMGKTDEALAAVDTGLRLSPDQIDLLVKRGELLFDLARFDEAEQDLDKALLENPTYPLAQYYKGRIHSQRKEWQEAAQRFEKMLGDGIRVNEVHFHLATAYRMLGESEKAQTQLDLSQAGSQLKIAGFDPVNMTFAELNVGDQPHILKASEYYRRGDVEKAIDELEIAHEKNPDNVGTHVNLVRMYGHNKQLDKAIDHYERAKAIDPEFSQLDSNLGFAYQTAGDFENAAIAYARAAEREPGNGAIQAELGFALGKTGNLDQAIIHFERSLELKPENRDLRYMLGEAYLKQKQYPEAIRTFKSALTPEDQKTIVVLRSLAAAQVLTSNREAAMEAMNQALELANRFDNQALVDALKADIERIRFSRSATGE